MPNFDLTSAGYHNMWNRAAVLSSRADEADRAAHTILKNRARYELVEKATGVPWFLIGCLHMRESDCDFRTHLHNGDSLSGYTHNVPSNRPQVGHGPPFTWEESAIDALTMPGKELDKIKAWPIERMLFQAEAYNGWGYTARGVNSPYLWAGTNLQQPGKYIADHVWSSTAMDGQLGVVTVLKRLAALDASVADRIGGGGHAPIPSPAPPSAPLKPIPPKVPPPVPYPTPKAGFWASILALFKGR